MTIEADIAWLRELEAKSWKDHLPSNPRQYGWREDLEVSKKDAEKVLELFKEHKSELLFEPGSGTFGFGVCINAYEVIFPSFPGVPHEVKHIITMTGKQLFPKSKQVDNAQIYKVFAHFTHSEENVKLRNKVAVDVKWFRENPLRSYSYYDY